MFITETWFSLLVMTAVLGAPENYVFFHVFLPWDTARQSCEHYGMTLVKIENLAKLYEIRTYMLGMYGGSMHAQIWMGLSVIGSGTPDFSKFAWPDGSTPDWALWYWDSPADPISPSFCGALKTGTNEFDYKFNTQECSNKRTFLCEGELQFPNPQSPTLPVLQTFYKRNLSEINHYQPAGSNLVLGETHFSIGQASAYPYNSLTRPRVIEDCIITCTEEPLCVSIMYTRYLQKSDHCILLKMDVPICC